MKEFIENGYLQEANRQFFHPLGLSMVVRLDEDGKTFLLGGILDCRDDEEGVVFGSSYTLEQANIRNFKATNVKNERSAKAVVRNRNFGWEVQPVEDILRVDSEPEGIGH